MYNFEHGAELMFQSARLERRDRKVRQTFGSHCLAQILKPNFCTFSIICSLVGGGPKHHLHTLGGVLPVTDTVEIMQVVLHACKIYAKEAPVTYGL